MTAATRAEPLYLDACATAPLAPGVWQAMGACQATGWANPSSLHGFGCDAAEQLERSRQHLGQLLGCPPAWISFCSGGTEAAHLAILGMAATQAPGRVVVSAVEHPAVLAAAQSLQRQGWQVSQWPVDQHGRIRLEELDALLAPPTRLVSLVWGQSEVGTLQPVPVVAEACRQRGVRFHTDAVQLLGHQALQLDALPLDAVTITAHKLGGPRGIGALVARPEVSLEPMFGGGAQEGGRRAGTEAVSLAVGFATALAWRCDLLAQHKGQDPLQQLRHDLQQQLADHGGVTITGCPRERLPHHLSLVVQDRHGQPIPGRALVREFWRQGLAVSSGTACSGGGSKPSATLLAMGFPEGLAQAGLRLSLGPWLDAGVQRDLPARILAALGRCQARCWT